MPYSKHFRIVAVPCPPPLRPHVPSALLQRRLKRGSAEVLAVVPQIEQARPSGDFVQRVRGILPMPSGELLYLGLGGGKECGVAGTPGGPGDGSPHHQALMLCGDQRARLLQNLQGG